MARSRFFIPWNDETTPRAYENVIALAADVAAHCPRLSEDDVAERLFRLIGWLYRFGR